MRETAYQRDLVNTLSELFPGCVVIKNDPSYIQGIPDLIVLYGPYWAALEVKISKTASTQPNQPYWVDRLDSMSYSAFVHPDNEEVVLNELKRAFGVGG